MPQFKFSDGLYPVVPTPMLDNDAIDVEGFKACVDFYLETDVSGVTILGSGGELPYFSDEEQYELINEASLHIQGKKPIIAGVNAFSSHQALQKINHYRNHAQVVMLLMQRYYDWSFTDFRKVISDIASKSPLPVIYYHFPQVSGYWLSPGQIVSLMEIDNIVGIKDSSLNNYAAKKILMSGACENYFTALSLFLPRLYPLGGRKAICPIAAIHPKTAQKVYEACVAGSELESNGEFRSLMALLPIASNPEQSADKLWRLLKLVSSAPFPVLKTAGSPHSSSKEALRLQGIPIQNRVRSPLPTITGKASSSIKQALQRAGITTLA